MILHSQACFVLTESGHLYLHKNEDRINEMIPLKELGYGPIDCISHMQL